VSIRLFLAEQYIPVFIKKRELKKLFLLAESAFERKAPSLEGLPFNDCLTEFALFTKTSVDQVRNRGEELSAVQARLFQQAYEYGKLWRKRLGIASMKEAMRGGRILYRVIGIDFQGTDMGVIVISKCLFSKYYSPGACEIISSLDAGMMAGLSDSEHLSFSQRITEGFDSCKANMIMKELVV
jgi:hypothetical protein